MNTMADPVSFELEPCSDANLRQSLAEPDGSSLLTAVASHVERCSRCRERLAELAAANEIWLETRDLLGSDAATDPYRQEWEERRRDRAARGDSGFGDSGFGHIADGDIGYGDLESNDSAHGDSALSSTTAARSGGADSIVAASVATIRQFLAPPSHPEMLGRLGRYEIERWVGAGGMGVVLKAFDTELNRPVAIKVLAPHLAASGAARQRFAREARAAAAVVHEHVVAIHNVESDGTLPFLVMQFVDGEPLQSRIDRLGMLDIATILRIARQTAAGLAAAHAQGLVHRDVKPGNILLVQDVDRALLTDFGLARAADDASLTHTGYHPGTPHYMSPEQARGELIDARSDLFSLGAVLYTMAVGRPPFRAETSFGVLRRITDTAPRAVRELNPQIPEWLAAIIDRLLEKDPAKRVESAARLAQLLESCLAHLQQPLAASLPDEVVAWTDEWRRRTTAVSSVVPSSSSGSSSHSTSSSSSVGARRSLLRRRDVWAACATLACGAALIVAGARVWFGDTSDEPRTGDLSGRSDVGRANAASIGPAELVEPEIQRSSPSDSAAETFGDSERNLLRWDATRRLLESLDADSRSLFEQMPTPRSDKRQSTSAPSDAQPHAQPHAQPDAPADVPSASPSNAPANIPSIEPANIPLNVPSNLTPAKEPKS